MKLTRNTKFYKMKDIIYRTLSLLELNVLENINNPIVKNEMAANFSIYNTDQEKVPYQLKIQIGEDILFKSTTLMRDPTMLEISVNDFKSNIDQGDITMVWFSYFIKYYPSTSFNEFINMNEKDIIELLSLAELMTGDNIFNNKKQKKGARLINPNDLPDGGKSLREEINSLKM